MYTKQEASALRQQFWTAFGQYMAPVASADGEKVTWLNYKTGEKGVHFKMEASGTNAVIAIELSQPDLQVQQIYFNQFKLLRTLLNSFLAEEWTWSLHKTDEWGKTVTRIYKELPGVSVFKKEDWPTIISFFKPRIIALDAFWSNARYGFEALR